jgi:hypothetical protein
LEASYDIKRHILRVRLAPPAGEAELEALAGRLLSQVLDRDKPLWEIHVVEGLKDGRGALIARIHHALADGVAGAALLRIMFDSTPEGSHAVRKSCTRPAPQPRGEPTLTEQISSAIQGALENVVAAEAAPPRRGAARRQTPRTTGQARGANGTTADGRGHRGHGGGQPEPALT